MGKQFAVRRESEAMGINGFEILRVELAVETRISKSNGAEDFVLLRV